MTTGNGGAGTAALAAMLQQLFAAEELDDVRQAIAHGAHVLAPYDTVTLREYAPTGALVATFRTGRPLDLEAKAVERHLRAEAKKGRTVTTLTRLPTEAGEQTANSYRRHQGLCLVRPLTAYGKRVGVICFHYAGLGALDETEFDCLRTFCDSAATALYNARARVDLRELAYTDPLTGLPNRRRLEAEMAKLRGEEVSILLIDFDGLKNVNDRLDYERGDALISLIGTALQRLLRPGDLAIRLGGDEFVVLLPRTDDRTAHVRAEEIDAALDALEVPGDIRPYFRGASVGSATARPDDDLQSVLRRATEEMHSRKRRRKTDLVPDPDEDEDEDDPRVGARRSPRPF